MRKMVFGIALLALGGCTGTVPVAGETADGERFTGTFSTPADGRGGGALALRGDKGAACDGRWQLDADRAGAAFITCDDGRTGTAELSVREAPGSMRGMLGGKFFKGSFDNPSLTSGK